LLAEHHAETDTISSKSGGHLRETLQGRMKIIARVNCITLAAIVLR
jgi:hypothetical protein